MGGTGSGQGGDPSPHTALGTLRGMQAALQHVGLTQFAGLTVAIQGVGNVGRYLAQLLHEHGANLIVADINQDSVRHVAEAYDAEVVGVDEILTTECDILAPCAMGAVIGEHNIADLKTRIVCGAANNQLVNPREDGQRLQDHDVLYAPDFIVNAGGVIHLAGLHLGLTLPELGEKIDEIESTTTHVLDVAQARGETTERIAEELARHRVQTGCTKERLHAH